MEYQIILIWGFFYLPDLIQKLSEVIEELRFSFYMEKIIPKIGSYFCLRQVLRDILFTEYNEYFIMLNWIKKVSLWNADI